MRDVPDSLGKMKHLFNNWWKILALAIIGGLLGLALSYAVPPVYEAQAIFSASIDFNKLNFENLAENSEDSIVFTQYEEDLALLVVHDVLLAQMPKALQYAQTLDATLNDVTFNQKGQIRRYHALWYLRYQHENPEVAQAIVNYWAEDGWKALRQAQTDGGVEDYVIVDLVSLANLPQKPIYQNRNLIVLVGLVIGFLSGIILVDYWGLSSNSEVVSAV